MRKRHRMFATPAFLAAVLALVAAGVAAAADEYRLQSGDSVAIYIDGALSLERPQTLGSDGRVAVAFAGHVSLAGRSVAEAQEAIREALVSRGLFTAPDVLVVVAEHRPIYVSGAVENPGAYPFAAEMTVARALALAGGPRSIGEESAGSPLAVFQYYNAVAGLADAQRAHLRATLALQRLEAHLAGAAEPDLRAPEGLDLDAAVVAAAIAAERERFALIETEAKEERALLETSIGLLETEIATVINRREELAALVAVLSAETENAQTLLDRGLRTQSNVVQSQRNLSLSRVDLLEMERAQTVAQQRLAEARQELRDAPRRRMLALGAERDERFEEVAATRERMLSFGRQVALFPGLLAESAAGAPETLGYEVHRGAGDTARRIEVDPTFAMAPGDLLVVRTLALAN